MLLENVVSIFNLNDYLVRFLNLSIFCFMASSLLQTDLIIAYSRVS